MTVERKQRGSRALSVLLALLTVLALLLPGTALAEENDPKEAGAEQLADTVEARNGESLTEGVLKQDIPEQEPAREQPQPEPAAEENEPDEPESVPAVDAEGQETKAAGEGNVFPVRSDGSRYYIAPGTAYAHTGWLCLEGKWYYFYADGALATGWVRTESGYTYYFHEDSGVMHKGWVFRGDTLYYMRPEDGRIQSGWRKIDDSWYYFGEDGKTRRGWAKSGGGYWYYFDPDTGAMQKGWQVRSGELYYMRPEDGKAQSDWRKIGDSWYYFGEDGRARRGWAQSAGGYWYCFDLDTGAMKTGFQIRNGNTYYMRPGDGKAQSGWRKIDDGWYYFGADGRMRTGWQIIDGKKYYFYRADDGLDGTVGVNASDITVDGFYVNRLGYTEDKWTISDTMLRYADGQYSKTKYLIMVDRVNCCMGIFEGSLNNWTRIRYEDCSPGAWSTPTPVGTYDIKSQGLYFDSYGSRCWYYSYFRAYGFCLHSVLYDFSGNVADGRLGRNLSHGCVRMGINTAYWIYKNCPVGTTVVIY